MDIERIRGVISQMKLPEKIALVGGGPATATVDRLKVPGISLTPELEPYSVKEPCALALGCTFSAALCQGVARYRSVEAIRAGRAFAGTIGCGLIMDPMRPDASEFFSEDPYLTAELLRHYASGGLIGYVFTDALGQGRFVNRTIDPRALYELYLYPLSVAGKYAAAVQLDGGYINGKKAAHSRTLSDVYLSYISADAMLITQYGDGCGPDGISGSGAYQLGASSADKRAINKAVVNGELSEIKLNKSIERTVATAAKAYGFYKNGFQCAADPVNVVFDSTVLLKNDGVLPAKPGTNITYFGDADCFDDASAYRVLPVRDAVKKYGTFNVFLVTDYESGGIPAAMSEAICRIGALAPTVVALCGYCAAPLPVENSCNAILFCPYAPTVYAINCMLSAVAPRGHLPFSWCKSQASYPRNNKKYLARGDFRYESVYNGYALFNNFKTGELLYPFGHGLDYTKYELSRLRVTCEGLVMTADFVIKNAGDFAGTALVQAYITLDGGNIYGMSKRLAAFKRVALEKTENAHIVMKIDLKDFPVYDENNNALIPAGGKYKVELGLSSADIRASAEIKVPAGSRVNAGLPRTILPSYYDMGGEFEPSAPEIERLLKVPFIKKPDEYPELAPPQPAAAKRAVKKHEKSVPARLMPVLRYKAETTPEVE